MYTNVIKSLCSLPATDGNFTSVLKTATSNQLRLAIETMNQNGGKNKGRIKACKRELENRRLTKKDKHGKYVSKEHLSILCNTFSSEHRLKAILNKLGEYEDAERQGLLLRLPCGIGSDVYIIPSKINCELNILSLHPENNKVYHQKVALITFTEKGWYMECDKDREYATDRILSEKMYKETWFLSQEEAEAKLKEMEKKDV